MFIVFNQVVTKDIGKIPYTSSLTVPITLDEDTVGHKKINVISTFNHSGKLARHYSSLIKFKWSKHCRCNDATAIPTQKNSSKWWHFLYFFSANIFLENIKNG